MKKLLTPLLLIFLGTFCAVLIIEVTLRLRPQIIGQEFANGLLTRYRHGDEGIYYHGETCEGLYFNLMKPNFTATAYYNGYSWQHQTDQYGFRNPPEHFPADMLLLGDSFIYGHGVDYEETVGYFLGIDGENKAYNLARQGDTIFQQHFLLNQYIDVVKPQYVFYFFYNNDITDLYDLLMAANLMTRSEMEAYFQQAVDRPDDFIGECEWENKFTFPEFPTDDNRSLVKRLTTKPYILRLPDFISFRSAQAAAPQQDPSAKPTGELPLAWEYLEQLVLEMNAVAAQNSAQLMMVPISQWNFEHHEKLREIAQVNGIPFIATYEMFNLESDPILYLENDGHFSAHGAEQMAKMLLSYTLQDKN